MKKGYLINSKNMSMREVDIKDWTDIKRVLNCRVFACADWMIPKKSTDSLYIDDEGLLVENDESNHCFSFYDYDPIYGRGLILGFDPDTGETTDRPLLPMEKYADSVVFGWSAKKPEPRIEVRSFNNFEDLFK